MLNLVTVESIRQNGLKLAVVAICTHKRPKMLEKCLMSLLAQDIPKGIIVHYVIVDNDAAESGRPSYIKFTNLCSHWSTYIVQPKRGIAAARNSARAYAIESDADYLLFIDDDEQADSKWIAGLLHPDYLDTPILFGLNIMDYADSIPAWARPTKFKFPAEGSSKSMGAGNVRLSRAAFEPHAFNENLELGGGEDGELFMRFKRWEFDMRTTKRAITYETAHPARHTISGIMDRAHWISAANMREEMIDKGRARIIAKRAPSMVFCFPVAIGQFIFGGLYLTIASIAGKETTRARRHMLRAGKTLAVAAGRWDAICKRVPQSYAHTVGE